MCDCELLRRGQRGQRGGGPGVCRRLRSGPRLVIGVEPDDVDVGVPRVGRCHRVPRLGEGSGIGVPHEAEGSSGHGPHGRHDLLEVRGVARLGGWRRRVPGHPRPIELPAEPQVRIRVTRTDQRLRQRHVVRVVGTRGALGQRGDGGAVRVGRDDRHSQRQRVAASLPGTEQPVQAPSGAVHARPSAVPRQVVGGERGRRLRRVGERRHPRRVCAGDVRPLHEGARRRRGWRCGWSWWCVGRVVRRRRGARSSWWSRAAGPSGWWRGGAPGAVGGGGRRRRGRRGVTVAGAWCGRRGRPEVGRRSVGLHDGVAAVGRVDDHAEGGHAGAARRAVVAGVTEGEDAAVGGDEPVAVAVGGRRHADDGLVEVEGARRAVSSRRRRS